MQNKLTHFHWRAGYHDGLHDSEFYHTERLKTTEILWVYTHSTYRTVVTADGVCLLSREQLSPGRGAAAAALATLAFRIVGNETIWRTAFVHHRMGLRRVRTYLLQLGFDLPMVLPCDRRNQITDLWQSKRQRVQVHSSMDEASKASNRFEAFSGIHGSFIQKGLSVYGQIGSRWSWTIIETFISSH